MKQKRSKHYNMVFASSLCKSVYAHNVYVRFRKFCLELELVTKCNLEYRIFLIVVVNNL